MTKKTKAKLRQRARVTVPGLDSFLLKLSKAGDIPYTPLGQLIKETEDKTARRLASLADEQGMRPRDVAGFLNLLDTVGLKPSDINNARIAQAEMIFNRHSQELVDFEKRWNAQFKPAEESFEEPQQFATSKSRRKRLYGFHVTAVIRWMGSDAWTAKMARQVLDKLGFEEVADTTIKWQINAGRTGKRGGEPAPLSEQQINQLYEHLD